MDYMMQELKLILGPFFFAFILVSFYLLKWCLISIPPFSMSEKILEHYF